MGSGASSYERRLSETQKFDEYSTAYADAVRAGAVEAGAAGSPKGKATRRMSQLREDGRMRFNIPLAVGEQRASDQLDISAKSREAARNGMRRHNFFSGFADEKLDAIVDGMQTLKVDEGKVIFPAEKNVRKIIYVESGSLLEIGHDAQTQTAVAGDVIVFGSLVDGPRSSEGIEIKSAENATVLHSIDILHAQQILVHVATTSAVATEAVVQAIPFLAPLTPSQRSSVASRLIRKDYEPGQLIIKQGTVGDCLYFITAGEVAVFQKSRGDVARKEVNRHSAGTFVGEAALLGDSSNLTRNADVEAVTPTTCWLLDRESFHSLFNSMKELMQVKSIARTLKAVDLMSVLSDDDREGIAYLCKKREYAKGDEIIKQGDDGDELFFIEQGEVEFTRIEEGSEEPVSIGRFFSAQYFGEGALLTAKPRRASAHAASDKVNCIVLSCEAVKNLLGETILRSASAKFSKRASSDKKNISAEDLNIVAFLGQGAFGKVSLVRSSVTGQTYALKEISRDKVVSDDQKAHMMSERRILGMIDHAFACNLIRTFRSRSAVYMLMDVVLGGDLYGRLKHGDILRTEEAKFYSAIVVSVLQYLHGIGIVYRDLKPENLLVAADGYLKLTDFGLAKVLEAGKTYTMCGTPIYAAPEVYACTGHNKNVDWWCLGVLLHEMICGYPPFPGSFPDDISSEISKYSRAYPRVEFPNICPHDLLLGLLHPDQNVRLGAGRFGASDVKKNTWYADIDWDKLDRKELKPTYIPHIEDSYDAHNFDDPRSKEAQKNLSIPEADIDEDDNIEEWCRDF